LERPPTARRATRRSGRARSEPSVRVTHTGRLSAIFLDSDFPARGHRVKGGTPGRRTRAVTDCRKLASSGFAGKRAILIYGFEDPDRPLSWLIDAFEACGRGKDHHARAARGSTAE